MFTVLFIPACKNMNSMKRLTAATIYGYVQIYKSA